MATIERPHVLIIGGSSRDISEIVAGLLIRHYAPTVWQDTEAISTGLSDPEYCAQFGAVVIAAYMNDPAEQPTEWWDGFKKSSLLSPDLPVFAVRYVGPKLDWPGWQDAYAPAAVRRLGIGELDDFGRILDAEQSRQSKTEVSH